MSLLAATPFVTNAGVRDRVLYSGAWFKTATAQFH
jgi:hypothetical protein